MVNRMSLRPPEVEQWGGTIATLQGPGPKHCAADAAPRLRAGRGPVAFQPEFPVGLRESA